MLNYLKKNYFINFFIVITIFFLDRISKFYVVLKSKINLSDSLFTSKFLNINLIWNDGIAFGLFSFNESFLYNLITAIIIIVIIINRIKEILFIKFNIYHKCKTKKQKN